MTVDLNGSVPRSCSAPGAGCVDAAHAVPDRAKSSRPSIALAYDDGIASMVGGDVSVTAVSCPGPSRSAVRGNDLAQDLLAWAADLLEPAHRAAIDLLPSELRHIAGYHIGWWDTEGRATVRCGKGLRPALTLACAAMMGSGAAGCERQAVPAAVAVELVHDFSLLHDDVMDRDRTRRHRPAAWTVFGVGEAILAGDALLTAAIHQLTSKVAPRVAAPALKALVGALQELCAGQSSDLAFEKRHDVSLAECLAMAEAKTGALLGAACHLGALVAGADPHTAGGYRTFGRELGLAFQLIDDVLGIWGTSTATGKPVGADLAARKRSLPIVAAVTSGTAAGEHLGRLLTGRGPLDEDASRYAVDLVEKAGGRTWACSEADRHVTTALSALSRVLPAGADAAGLRALTGLVMSRDR